MKRNIAYKDLNVSVLFMFTMTITAPRFTWFFFFSALGKFMKLYLTKPGFF